MKIKDYLIISFVTIVLAILLKVFVVDVVYIPSHSMESTLIQGDYVIVNKMVYGERALLQAPLPQASFFHFPGFRNVEPGDVILFHPPDDIGRDNPAPLSLFVKRCVAVGGDRLSVKNGVVSVNGRELLYVKDIPDYPFLAHLDGSLIVPRKGDHILLSKNTIGEWFDLIRRDGHFVDTTNPGISVDGKPMSSYTIGQNYVFVLGDNRDNSFDSASWGLLPENNIIGEAEIIYWSQDISRSAAHWYDRLSTIRWNRIGMLVR